MVGETNKDEEIEVGSEAATENEDVVQDEAALDTEEATVPLEDSVDVEFTTFAEAGLDPELVETVASLGWSNPTKIQGMCLPHTLAGKDLAGFAQTGTGKTGVFIITIAQRLLEARKKDPNYPKPFCVILSPTRELAMQIESDASGVFEKLGISSLAVFGGVDYEKQAKQLSSGVDVVVATPGRLKDFFQKRIFTLSQCPIFVCDEADRMFDMGFIDDVKFFLDKLPENGQKLLFSATTNPSVAELAFEYLDKPRYISATPESITPEAIEQHAILCETKNKLKVMIGLLREHKPFCAIIFTNTKIAAEWLQFKLNGNGFESDIITGDLPQRKRMNLIKRIKEGQVKALIATDVASRGLHIAGVTHVYNFDLPNDPSNYVHRIGRTARAGAKGHAYSLVCEDYGENLRAINELLGNAAMKSEWYDPSYDEIVDQAGNPFPSRGKGEGKQRDSRDRQGAGRGQGGSDRGRRPQGERRGERSGDQQGRRHQQQGNGQERERNHDGQRRQRGGRNDRNKQRKPHYRDQQRPLDRGASAKPTTGHPKSMHGKGRTTDAAPTSFFGLVKKMFATIFGAGKPKDTPRDGKR